MMDSDVIRFFGVMMSIAVAGGFGYALIRLINAFARRIGGSEARPALPDDRLTDLEARVAQLEDLTARIGDVEERVDFVERRLVEGQAAQRISKT